MLTVPLEGIAGLKLRACDGMQELAFPEMMSTPLFYLAQPGDRLRLLDYAYKYVVATYTSDIDPRWLYTYDYAPDQSWTVYRHDLSGDRYRQDDYIFGERVYFRICMRKVNGGLFDGSEDMNAIMQWDTSPPISAPEKKWIAEEAERVAHRVEAFRRPGDKVFALLTDSHYTVNGTWEDTTDSIRKVHSLVRFDGIVHLGDFTDGMVTGAVTKHYVNRMLNDLNDCDIPVWVALGNHDSNYFRKNPERLSLAEQSWLYLGADEPRYVIDFEKQRMRFIFLESFDSAEELRYGYSPACVEWLAGRLVDLQEGWKVIIFSHLPPETRLQYWTKAIRGERDMMCILNAHSDKILAFINGHNHADLLDNAGLFPVVSIGNAKCESFLEYKPNGFFTPERRLGEAAQELWDVMMVASEKRSLRFIRFGAGRDRIIEGGRAEWL